MKPVKHFGLADAGGPETKERVEEGGVLIAMANICN